MTTPMNSITHSIPRPVQDEFVIDVRERGGLGLEVRVREFDEGLQERVDTVNG